MRNFSRHDAESQREPFLRPSLKMPSNSAPALANITNSPPISILAYCLASISMTVTNKYCVSGKYWNLNFFYLAIQVRISLKDVHYVLD